MKADEGRASDSRGHDTGRTGPCSNDQSTEVRLMITVGPYLAPARSGASSAPIVVIDRGAATVPYAGLVALTFPALGYAVTAASTVPRREASVTDGH